MDVEITVDFGGTDQERLFIFNVQVQNAACLRRSGPSACARSKAGGSSPPRHAPLPAQCVVDAGALMVVDRRGRIPFATTQLASLLGFPLRSLINMELANLIPAPYGQLHAGFLKVRPACAQLSSPATSIRELDRCRSSCN